MTLRLSDFAASLFFHIGLGACLFYFTFFDQKNIQKAVVEFEVIENPTLAPVGLPPLELRPLSKPQVPTQKVEGREVFGISKSTLTEDSPSDQGALAVEVKQGNTLAAAPDDRTLLDTDVARLPIPTADHLVTRMPSLISEVRIPYPPLAKQKNIEGPVVMDILIDEQGNVRQVQLVSGPGEGLNEAALAAIAQFKFKPASIEKKNVAVRIRYTYRFVLQQ